jgi:acetylornithine deacetylase/succinyl-diaminopimelate desuccinylase-like protein
VTGDDSRGGATTGESGGADRDRRRAVRTAAEALVSRRSENPPGAEAPVAEWLAGRFADSPVAFDVATEEVEPGRPNVVARAGDPSRGSVLLTGHTDVVPADPEAWTTHPYEPTVRDGRLHGRGTADMKGAVGAMVVAAERYLARTTAPGEVVLAFVVDEEHDGAGTRALVEGGVDADVAVVGEPTDLDVCTATKGVARYDVTVHGESCHSGRPDEGRDAVRGLAAVVDRVAALDDDLEATTHPVLSHEDATVTEASGGLAPNVVADRARATVDWRFLPGRTRPAPFDRRVREVLSEVTVEGTPFEVTVERSVFARAAETDPDHPAVAAVRAAAADCGVPADTVGFDAATDARFLVHDAGVPTVHFGPGSLAGDAHAVDESVALADLEAAAAVYEAFLGRWHGEGDPGAAVRTGDG